MDPSLSPHSEIPHEPLFPNQGASFGTHTLSTESTKAWRFHPSFGMIGFAMALSGLGLAGAIMGIGGFIALGEVRALLIATVGGGFHWLGRYLYHRVSLPREVDFRARCIRFPKGQFFGTTEIHEVGFDEVRALQIVEKFIHGSEQDFHSFELNLIMEDGTRFNILDHGNRKRLIEDATRIATRLGKDLIVEEL